MENNIRFYPHVTEDNCGSFGIEVKEYILSYSENDIDIILPYTQSPGVLRIDTNTARSWKVVNGLRVRKSVVMQNPALLKGASGVIPKDADFELLLIWKNKAFTQAGCILPVSKTVSEDSAETQYDFDYSFEKGAVGGNIELSLSLIISKAAENVEETEQVLMNDPGVSVGEIESVIINTDDNVNEFPINDNIEDASKPMWWLEINWDDPRTSDFIPENLCIYLNKAFQSCPMDNGKIRNKEMLVDILSTAYLMIIEKIKSNDEFFIDISNDSSSPGSIGFIIQRFVTQCSGLFWEQEPEEMLKHIQSYFVRVFKEL